MTTSKKRLEAACPDCGTPLEEVPFTQCKGHQTYWDSLPAFTDEELEEFLSQEMNEALFARTGDD